VADGILLERAGVPAVSICTDAFRVPGAAMARVHGAEGYPFALMPHPLASRDAAQIRQIAAALVPQVLRILGVEGTASE
jgi:hypothetical protein